MQDVDIVVIGAGAAGLAAAQRLSAEQLDLLVLEASPRVGGRAWTRESPEGLPLDIGCGWLHSGDRNPWTSIAEAGGFTVDRTAPPWGTQAGDIHFSPEEQAEFHDAFDAFERRLAAARSGPDRPAGELLDPGGRWNPLIDAIGSYINGAEYDRVSLHDYLAYAYADTGVNWRVAEGYGALIAAFGAGLPVRLDTPVTEIDHRAERLRIVTPHGELRSRAAIVTVSTAVLAAERLRFTPALPDKVEAASHLPLGLADKLFLKLDEPEALPADAHLFGRTDTTATGSYHLRPLGRPLIEVYLGGRHAEALEVAGDGAATAFAIEELVGLLGSDFARQVTPITVSGWRRTAHVLGSYSYAQPGHASARVRLAEPVDGRIFFAGEACSTQDFSTAHGAYETGVRAAEQVVAALTSHSLAP